MSAPTAPTIDTLTVEALKQAGYLNAAAGDTIQTRSEIWFEEAKGEIWRAGEGKFKSLQTSNMTGITTASGTSNMEGKALWDNPADFALHIGMTLLQGTHYGVCQAGGSSTTAILAAAEDMPAAYAIGKEIVIFVTGTQTTCESAFIRNFDTTTKVATFHEALPSISPGTTHTYLVVDDYQQLKEGDLTTYNSNNRGIPDTYVPIGDQDVAISTIVAGGQFMLSPVPYFNSDGKPRALRHRYYANLTRVDNDDSAATKIMAKILTNWRAEFTQYIKYKALANKPGGANSNIETERTIWEKMKQLLIARETYDNQLSNMRGVVNAD